MVRKFRTYSILLVLIFVSVLIGILGFFFSIKPSLLQEVSFSQAVYDDRSRLLRLTLSDDDKYRYFVPLDKISPELVAATLLQEDQYFFQHPGFNPWATLKAVWQTYVVKSRRIGASTITMQLARMQYGLYSKNISGKLWQILYAIRLEFHYNKKELLEAYLNLAPYGNNIEGVGAASLIYFAKSAAELSLPESLLLSVIPQNPIKSVANHAKLKESRNKLAARWLEQHPEDQFKLNGLRLPIQLQNLKNLPFFAPHFVNHVLQDNRKNQRTIMTTLDLKLQKITEQVARRYIDRKKYLGVYNTSILLVDVRDMSIKAYTGSADFYNLSIGGQIDGLAIKRSPGSTLKPFIYGLALDQGLIHPNTVLKDVPRSFGAYNPENFDYEFVGPVKAKDALVLSRNIPAIYLAEQLKQPDLYDFLKQAHIKLSKPANYYGLALVLGGAELSTQELAGLYAMLVNNGMWHDLRWQKDKPLKMGTRLLSAEASFLVLEMLKDREHTTPVSWKTGTSSGFRDAWSVGVFGQYVLVVWLGNFNNQSNPAFVGKSLAAPLMFELIQAIEAEYGAVVPIYKNPNHLQLTKVNVCKASGMLPTRYCNDTEESWFIPGKSPIKTDTIFREVAIDKKTGLRTCEINENTVFQIYEFWPSDLLRIFKQAGFQRRTPPAYSPSCYFDANGFSPQITSPKQTISYIMRNYVSSGDKIPFTATVDADVKKIYWFLNEVFLGESQPEKAYLWPAKPGKYIVRVVDDHGRSDAIDLIVKGSSV